ncbi:hypothetical protein WJX72_004084 [[Myrmecia] bisecta]|uniref:Uncharacterized protein n=1 Tax=[Myrmecia] bisecta TaxID=41462 RepID=A0AAW1Q547_9CHLO
MDVPAEQPAEQNELVEFLIDSARYGDLEDVQQALDSKLDPSACDEDGRTALHMASANGHTEVVRLLVDAGADIGSQNKEGNTPLHWACLNGHEAVARFLLQHGASPSCLNSHTRTPVDECLGRPFQDAMMDVVNSFSKVPTHVTSFEAPSPAAASASGSEPDADAVHEDSQSHDRKAAAMFSNV